MASVSTYLNFPGTTEKAFAFYKSVFGTDYSGPIVRFSELPADDEAPPLSEEDKNLILHVALPILGGHVVMGTDCIESMGQPYKPGNNVSINLQPDTRADAKRLFDALSDGGKIDMPLQDMFWGDYFGAVVDRFGTQWMINCSSTT